MSSSTSSTHPSRPRSSSTASRSPRARVRPLPPPNPPDPPLTLLSSVASRSAYNSGARDQDDEEDWERSGRIQLDGDVEAASGATGSGFGSGSGFRGQMGPGPGPGPSSRAGSASGREEDKDHGGGGGVGSGSGSGSSRASGSQAILRDGRQQGGKRRGWYSRFGRRIGKGIIHDIKARAPYYPSDWTDAWNYRVIPATWFIFFANVFPGIAFSLDLIENTGEYGVQEVLLATFASAFIASIFGGQPLTVLGVTGPITVFNKVIFDIVEGAPNPPNYLQFMGWVYVWGAIIHVIAALIDACSLLKYVTRFSCDTFGFYVAAVYVQYGIQVVERQFTQSSSTASFLGIILAILTLVLPHYFNAVAGSGYGTKAMRRFCSDYGMPITVIAMSGLAYWGYFNGAVNEPQMRLPIVEASFQAANGRAWLVRFWQLEARWVGIAFPFGLVLFILFYFDHNVSSLIAQGSDFPLRKPPGFHWDFFLLGITIFLAGLLGFPAPNGLIPQAPLHTASLVVMGYEEEDATVVNTPVRSNVPEEAVELEPMRSGDQQETRPDDATARRGSGLKRRLTRGRKEKERRASVVQERDKRREVPVAVVEQRVSNLAQGCLCLILMTAPFEHVLGLIPKGVLAGLFWFMGTDALLSSGVTEKMLYLIRDRQAISPSHPLNGVRRSRIFIFLLVELVGFGATFAVTQTIAAIGFPIIIMALVPVRIWVVPRLGISKEELDILDGPVASAFTLESVGGSI